MSTDLFRGKRNLPALNVVTGRKTIDASQQRLENSRHNNPEKLLTKSLSPKPQLKPLLSPGNRLEKQKKELRVSQPIATDRHVRNKLKEAMEEYGLEFCMRGEPNQTLTTLMADTSRKSIKERDTSHSRMSSTESMFHKKELSTDLNSSKLTSVTPGNFVFQKKKASIRDSNHLEHIYHYALGTGIASPPQNSLGLNGKKVHVREVLQKQLKRQQKRYLKELKLDSVATFKSTTKDFGGSTERVKGMLASSKKRLLQPSSDFGIENFKAQIAVSLNRAGHLDYSLKLNPKVLDGSYLETLNFDSPGRTKGSL